MFCQRISQFYVDICSWHDSHMSYHLGRVGTCLWWILDNSSLKMLKNCFCLCSCMRGLRPAYAACIHAYVDLFLLTQVCSWGFVYVGINLRTWGSCLRVWALTYVREMPGRSLALPIFTYFSPVSLPYAMLTHIFVIYVFEYHYIILFTFTYALQYHFLRISLESWI